MLDLSTLKKALEPLSKIGRDEHTFDAGGMQITIRPLLPMEEVAVQRYAASVLDDLQAQEGLDNQDQMSRAAALDYFDRFRIEIIANSIVQVGDLDLREVKTLPTGEVLENGVQVQIPKGLAMREIVQGWSRAMITICFARYGDLVQQIADEADKIAQTTLPDLQAEIERVEKRLERLKADYETRAKGDPSITNQQITNLINAGKAIQQHSDEVADKIHQEVVAKRGRAPVYPSSAPPPTVGPDVKASAPVVSSFGDANTPDMQALEEQRILQARKAAAEARQQEPMVDPLKAAKPVGQVGGVDAYRLPSADLSPRGRNHKQEAPQQNNPDAGGVRNPNFKPSGQ